MSTSRSSKAARKSVLADHETDREETILRSQIRLMEERILKLEELDERISAIEDVVAQFDEAEKSQASKSAKNRVPLNILQDAFHQHAEELKAAMESKTWKELDEDLRKQLTSSVEALLIFKKYPIPNSTALTKRIKDFYTTRRTTVIIKSDPEKKKKRRLALKRSRLTYAARDKAVKTAILSGELNVDDEEGIDRIRSSVQLVPISEARVLSDEEEERTAFEQQRLENLSRARAVRAARQWLPIIQYQLNTTLHGVMKTTPYELVFDQPPRLSVFPGAKCGSNIMEEDLEDIINDHLPSKSDDQPPSDQPPSESDDQPPSKSRAQSCSFKSRAQTLSDDQPPSESDDQPPSKSRAQSCSKSHAQTLSDDQPPSESDDQPPSKSRAQSCSFKSRAQTLSDDQPPSKSRAQSCSKSHAQTLSDDQPPSESDDQPPSISDTQHLSKSHAQDVSESDDQALRRDISSLSFKVQIWCSQYQADLECYKGDLGLDAQDWKALTRLSLRQAAIKSNPKNDFMVSHCQFMQMRGTICTSKCHKGSECQHQAGQVAILKQGSSKRDRNLKIIRFGSQLLIWISLIRMLS
ncbi:hypothetical protein EMCRGX_G017685 [Ephydatia muelleri]